MHRAAYQKMYGHPTDEQPATAMISGPLKQTGNLEAICEDRRHGSPVFPPWSVAFCRSAKAARASLSFHLSMSINALLLILPGMVRHDEVSNKADPTCLSYAGGDSTSSPSDRLRKCRRHGGVLSSPAGMRSNSQSNWRIATWPKRRRIRRYRGDERPGGAGEPQGQAIPLPGAFQALTGCENPNTGVASSDWGVGTDPVYTVIDNTAPVVGEPIYSSNAVFWTSRENAPGQSILLTGAFTDAAKTARLAFIPPGTMDWQTLVRGSTTVISTVQQGTTGLSFIVPSSFPAGVYGYEIDDRSAPPVLGLANLPALSWAIGVPSTNDSTTALQHQVHDCGVEQGGILRLFGKNFAVSNQLVLQSSSGVPYSLTPSKLDSNSVAAPVPSNLPPGTYNLWIGTSPWSSVSSPAGQITVYAPVVAGRPQRHLF